MAQGRTISANLLTGLDKKVIGLCRLVSGAICDSIPGGESRQTFAAKYGKISETRDGGSGLGGGKIQRDAVCTRGRSGKAPFSNRNLRWHPLIVADSKPDFAEAIERIEIDGQDDGQTLVFVVKNRTSGRCESFPSDRVYQLPERYVALPEHWYPHVETLRHWSDTLWTQNSCVISAVEACDWRDAVETYAVLGVAVAVARHDADFDSVYEKVARILKEQAVDGGVSLPTGAFPAKESDIIKCPLCLLDISEDLEGFRKSEREATWQPSWRPSKKSEGGDSSIQMMHVNPLIESRIRHTADNVRYGHRWCNVSMADHSLDETLDFMEFILRARGRGA